MATKAITAEDKQAYQKTVFFTAKQAGLNDVQAKIIVAQATLESGNFKSNVFEQDNNLFGMKLPSVRPKTYIAGASKIVMKSEGATPYASFSTVADSVRDLILGYHKYKGTDWSKIQTPVDYSTYLKSKNYYGVNVSIKQYADPMTSIISRLTFLKFTLPFGLLFFFNSNFFHSKTKILKP